MKNRTPLPAQVSVQFGTNLTAENHPHRPVRMLVGKPAVRLDAARVVTVQFRRRCRVTTRCFNGRLQRRRVTCPLRKLGGTHSICSATSTVSILAPSVQAVPYQRLQLVQLPAIQHCPSIAPLTDGACAGALDALPRSRASTQTTTQCTPAPISATLTRKKT